MDRHSGAENNTSLKRVIEIIGSFFVDTFYNHHFLTALEHVKKDKAKNTTDAFRNIVISYMQGSTTDPDLYKRVVLALHEYYQKFGGHGASTFSDFQDRILIEFVPADYWATLIDRHKDTILRNIIVAVINDFGEYVLGKDVLRLIIDKHMDKANVYMLQDRISQMFMAQRDDWHGKFVSEIAKKGSNNVSRRTLNKLRDEFALSCEKNKKLIEDNARLTSMVRQLLENNTILKARIEALSAVPSHTRSQNTQQNSQQNTTQYAPPTQSTRKDSRRRHHDTASHTASHTTSHTTTHTPAHTLNPTPEPIPIYTPPVAAVSNPFENSRSSESESESSGEEIDPAEFRRQQLNALADGRTPKDLPAKEAVSGSAGESVSTTKETDIFNDDPWA